MDIFISIQVWIKMHIYIYMYINIYVTNYIPSFASISYDLTWTVYPIASTNKGLKEKILFIFKSGFFKSGYPTPDPTPGVIRFSSLYHEISGWSYDNSSVISVIV
jgi:hypothetical protein